MSIARVQSFAFAGIDAQPVEVQVQISGGLPNFLMLEPITPDIEHGITLCFNIVCH